MGKVDKWTVIIILAAVCLVIWGLFQGGMPSRYDE
jgi:hypothetical protein